MCSYCNSYTKCHSSCSIPPPQDAQQTFKATADNLGGAAAPAAAPAATPRAAATGTAGAGGDPSDQPAHEVVANAATAAAATVEALATETAPQVRGRQGVLSWA